MVTCARVVVDPDVPSFADTHERTRSVHTHGVLTAVMAPFCTLVDVYKGKGGQRSMVANIGEFPYDFPC